MALQTNLGCRSLLVQCSYVLRLRCTASLSMEQAGGLVHAKVKAFHFSSTSGDHRKGGKGTKPSSPTTIKSPLSDMLAKMDLNKKSSSSRERPGERTPESNTRNRVMHTENNGFRGRAISAISILHGDYEDYDEIGNNISKAQRNQKTTNATDEQTTPKDADLKSSEIFDWEERMRQQKLMWAEKSKPIVRDQELDERGRAYGRGGRKTSTARVFLFPGEGHVTINRIDMVDYFYRESLRALILSPFVATKTCGMFDVFCSVEGGGLSGKAGAIRHGIARALEKYNPELRPPLKVLGYLTRDPRKVERKKPGLKKARKAKQWVKR